VGVAAAAAFAGIAGVSALANGRAEKAEEARLPPAGRFLRLGRARLHYVERGVGPPVLLFHGNGATWADFAVSGLMDRLAERHRVIAFDRPGFGHSARPVGRRWTAEAQAALLMRAARALGVHRPVVVGHSWGALVGLHAAIAFPDELAGLVLLGGYLVPERRMDVALLSIPGLPLIGRLISYTLLPILARHYSGEAVGRIFAPNPVPERFLRRFPAGIALRASQLYASSQDNASMNASAAAAQRRLDRIKAPVAILAGAEDAIVDTDRHSAALHRNLPGSTFEALPGIGHMMHYFARDEVAAAVERMASAPPAPDRAYSGADDERTAASSA
jgi:pimeloyl-ACP methyl ester carboxylesterase